ncbi:MAG: glycosyltransferase family 39 protein, partial [Candidatus Levybacteria bacterium]|nr:glycosyltransferase family 39 protein [Candidatus Levybacteria bacterium]
MFSLAILIGIYSYLIFGLGLLEILYKTNIILVTLIYGLAIFYIYKNKIKMNLFLYFKILKKFHGERFFFKKNNLFPIIAIFILILQGIINLVGALGLELGFDALWYHLTIPKIYLQSHSVFNIPGGLLYYSTMPKLTEMLYVVGLALGSDIFAKLIHFSFGILTLIALYRLSRKFLSKTYSLLVLVLFYSNLVVGWMSITAYIDLARTFFEIMALWGFVNWIERKEEKWLIVSAVLLGLAISTKLLAVGSLLIFAILIIIFTRRIFNVLTYCFCALLIPLPWFVFSYIHTANPIYPFFTSIYPVKFNFNLINPLNLSDPISPIYIIFLPIALVLYRKFKLTLKIIALYSFFSIIIWYITPQTGGGRFILPYLPALSLVTVAI